MCHIDPCPPPIPVYHRHHYRRRRRCPLVGRMEEVVLLDLSADKCCGSSPLRLSPSLPKLRSSPRRKGIRVRRPTDRRIDRMPTPYNYLAATAAAAAECLRRYGGRPAFSALPDSSAVAVQHAE